MKMNSRELLKLSRLLKAELRKHILGYAELAEPEVRRLTMDDAIRALEVLGREREVDSLVERAAKADSGTSWAAPSSIRMAMRRVEPILRMDVVSGFAIMIR